MKTRHIAHITIEAETPLKVGSNASDFLQDSPVQKDWNGLPMILGTSIAGVLRKDFQGDVKDIFGEECGSKVIFSNALLLNEKAEVYEELLLEKTPFLQLFYNLPIREHTIITDKGVSGNKFDEEVVYKGTRFKFSIEMIEDDKESFDEVLNLLYSSSFRLGGGSTKGFGKVKIFEIKTASFNRENYKSYSSSLNYVGLAVPNNLLGDTQPTNYTKYTLRITPDDFFMFGSGFGDSDADSTPVYEKVIKYDGKNSGLTDKQILIPASSIKGALSHRTAFYYNKAIDATIESGNAKVGENNDAVKAIFGHKKEFVDDKELGQKGKILISDCFKNDNNQTKTFDHVAIDRFTGGAMDGALFQEKTIADDREYKIEILLEKNIEEKYIKAFQDALNDICIGMLPLGGMTTKGHGSFCGNWSKK